MNAKFVKVPVTVETDMIELIISPEEALTLRVILGRIGGDSKYSLRKYVDVLIEKMEDLGINYPYQGNQWTTGMESCFTDASLDLLKYAPKPKD